jgi:hypothetical protein
MADIQQLATILGTSGAVSIRKTDEAPPRLSVIDVAILATGADARKTAQDIGYARERFPEAASLNSLAGENHGWFATVLRVGCRLKGA